MLTNLTMFQLGHLIISAVARFSMEHANDMDSGGGPSSLTFTLIVLAGKGGQYSQLQKLALLYKFLYQFQALLSAGSTETQPWKSSADTCWEWDVLTSEFK